MPIDEGDTMTREARSGLKQARAAATRASIVTAAREIFAETGYHNAGIAEIVERAGITRGGLYYHFEEKRDLYDAVVSKVKEEKYFAIVNAVEPLSGDFWEHFVESLKHKLQITASDQEVQRVLTEGPAVLGWQRWATLQSGMAMEVIAKELDRMVEVGIARPVNTRIAAQLILAVVYESSLSIAHAEQPQTTLRDATETMVAMVEGLRFSGAHQNEPEGVPPR